MGNLIKRQGEHVYMALAEGLHKEQQEIEGPKEIHYNPGGDIIDVVYLK